MDITIEIEDHIVDRAKSKAEALGMTLSQLVEEHLRAIFPEDDAEDSEEI